MKIVMVYFLRNTQSAYQLMNRMQPATCRYLWYLYSVLFYVHVKNEQVYQIFISHLVCCIMKSVTCMCGVPRYNAHYSTCISVNYPIEQYVVHVHDSIIMMVVNFFVYYCQVTHLNYLLLIVGACKTILSVKKFLIT